MVQIEQITISELKTLIADVLQNEVKQPETTIQEDTEYITRQETAEILRISLPTLNEYTKKGILPGYRLGSRVRYKKNEVENALKRIQTIKYRGV